MIIKSCTSATERGSEAMPTTRSDKKYYDAAEEFYNMIESGKKPEDIFVKYYNKEILNEELAKSADEIRRVRTICQFAAEQIVINMLWTSDKYEAVKSKYGTHYFKKKVKQ